MADSSWAVLFSQRHRSVAEHERGEVSLANRKGERRSDPSSVHRAGSVEAGAGCEEKDGGLPFGLFGSSRVWKCLHVAEWPSGIFSSQGTEMTASHSVREPRFTIHSARSAESGWHDGNSLCAK